MRRIIKLIPLIVLSIAVFSSFNGFAQSKDKKQVVTKRESERKAMHSRDSLLHDGVGGDGIEIELAVEVVGGAIVQLTASKASAELDEVRPVRDRGVVLKFVIILIVEVQRKGTAAGEGVGYGNVQLGIDAGLRLPLAEILEPRLVDDRALDDLRLGQIEDLVGVVLGVRGVREIEAAHALVLIFLASPRVASLQSNVGRQLVIDARTDAVERIRRDDRETLLDGKKSVRIDDLRIDQRIFPLLAA